MDSLQLERRAQTHIQLYDQLRAGGRGRDDIVAVHQAYRVATTLFAGQLRPEGRPFVCHVVGVASILAMIDVSCETIIAGLLHSAYTHGDFGYGRGELTPASRDSLRAAVGDPVEQLVNGYAEHPWNGATVASWVANATNLDPSVRQIAIVRLANAVEDALDYGLLMSAKGSTPTRRIPVARLVELANALGHPALGASLRDVLDDALSLPEELIALRDWRAGSYFVCPLSWHEKPLRRLARLLTRASVIARMAAAPLSETTEVQPHAAFRKWRE